jgi:hypothetical protein
LDNPGGHGDPGGRPGHGSTLRFPVSGLLPEVGGGRFHRHRLQLYIIGSVQDDGVGTLSYVLRQPILAASTSGIAGRRPSATRPRLPGHGCCETCQATGQWGPSLGVLQRGRRLRYGFFRQLIDLGHGSTVAAPLPIAYKPGERIKTSPFSPQKLALQHRFGDLAAAPSASRSIGMRTALKPRSGWWQWG